VGYANAGFQVEGVDIEFHRDYPYRLWVRDAMEVLEDVEFLRRFDVIHASPPCPRYSVAGSIGSYNPEDKPDLIGPVRDALVASSIPWVMENVPGAPMPNAVTICGWAMGLQHIRRHRLFESSVMLMSPGCACPVGDTVSVFGHSGEDRRKSTMQTLGRVSKHVPLDDARALMGVDWMRNRDDVSDAIPPRYTEFIGEQLMDALVKA
jgi:DNA (cytosine-5)-methyltransferase 1